MRYLKSIERDWSIVKYFVLRNVAKYGLDIADLEKYQGGDQNERFHITNN